MKDIKDQIKEFRKEYPEVTLQMHQGTPEQIAELAAAGDVADVNQLLGTLRSHAALHEYEATHVGRDVTVVDVRKMTRKGDGSVTQEEKNDQPKAHASTSLAYPQRFFHQTSRSLRPINRSRRQSQS